MASALIIIFGTMVLTFGIALWARFGKEMSLDEWAVGGRSFGGILVFLLTAGEIYTTFSLLGGSGFAYGRGGPTYFVFVYACLAYVMSYWLLPPIWRYGKEHGLVSQPEFFAHKYKSPALGLLIATIGILALIPYLSVQLKGLGIIVETAGYGAVSAPAAIWIGLVVMTTYVMISGVRGPAWTAGLKDIAIVAVVLFLGIYFPLHYYGGFAPMFDAIQQAKPGFLALPERGTSIHWFYSTVIVTTVGFFMWPHFFATVYTAKNENSFRKNAVFLPLYQLMLIFVYLVGFAAILQVPGLKGPDIDLALLRLSAKSFDPWFVGVIGAAGVLTALVPGSMILMATSALIADNFYRRVKPNATSSEISLVAKLIVPVVSLLAVYMTLQGGKTIVAFVLMGFSLIAQFFPALLCSLMKTNRVTSQGAFWGVAVGAVFVVVMTLTQTSIGALLPSLPVQIKEIHVGVFALLLNIITMVVVSQLTRGKVAVASASHA